MPHHLGPHQLRFGFGRCFEPGLGADAIVFDHRRVALLHRSGQTRQEIAEADLPKGLSVQRDAVVVRRQDMGAIRHRGPADRGVVVEDGADTDDAVGPIDDLPGSRAANLAPVDAGKLRMILREKALGGSHDGDRATKCLSKLDGLLFRARCAQLAADQQQWLLPASQKRRRRGNRSLQRLGVALFLGEHGADRSRRGAGSVGNVAGDLDIGRLLFAQCRADRMVDLSGRIGRGGNGDGGTGDLPCDLELI